jgi:hypothetical protein
MILPDPDDDLEVLPGSGGGSQLSVDSASTDDDVEEEDDDGDKKEGGAPNDNVVIEDAGVTEDQFREGQKVNMIAGIQSLRL